MRRALSTLILSSAALACGPAIAREHLVEVDRSRLSGYSTELQVAAGRFKELCVALKAGDHVDWRFSSSAEVDFNVHFHVGEAVRYPEQLAKSKGAAGALSVEADQHYCWMWKAATSAGTVSVSLDRKP